MLVRPCVLYYFLPYLLTYLLNQISEKSKSLILHLSQSTPQCALLAKTCQIDQVTSALLRCIRWSKFGREVHLGSADRQQSLAEKGLFSSIAGKFTHKILARVSILVVGRG